MNPFHHFSNKTLSHSGHRNHYQLHSLFTIRDPPETFKVGGNLYRLSTKPSVSTRNCLKKQLNAPVTSTQPKWSTPNTITPTKSLNLLTTSPNANPTTLRMTTIKTISSSSSSNNNTPTTEISIMTPTMTRRLKMSSVNRSITKKTWSTGPEAMRSMLMKRKMFMKHNNLSSLSYRTTRSVLTGKMINTKQRDTRKFNSLNNPHKPELLNKLNNNSSSVRYKDFRESSRQCNHHNQSIYGSPKTLRQQRLCSRKSFRPS